MTNFYALLRRLGTINLLGGAALIVTIAMAAFLGLQGHDLRTNLAPCGILSLELAFTERNAQDVVSSWTGKRHGIAVRQILADFIFIAAYSWLALYLGFKSSGRAQRHGAPTLAKAARIAGLGGLAAGVLDCLENVGMLLMLAGHISPGVAFFTSLFAASKFALLGIGAVVAILSMFWPAAKSAPA